MNKNNGQKSGAGHPTGSSPSLAKELGEIINEIQRRRYITERVVELLKEWATLMKGLLEEEEIIIEYDGKGIGFGYFDDWSGTTRYWKYEFVFDAKFLPDTRDQIGKKLCNQTNTLSRVWTIMDINDLRYLIKNIDKITIKILSEYNRKLPENEEYQKLKNVVKILKKV
ncbi:MAG TPA: hypothetical protein ENG40_00795 [Thermoprotei archaeon]|nr:hypothetical protein [Thermoprotei archaeon]